MILGGFTSSAPDLVFSDLSGVGYGGGAWFRGGGGFDRYHVDNGVRSKLAEKAEKPCNIK